MVPTEMYLEPLLCQVTPHPASKQQAARAWQASQLGSLPLSSSSLCLIHPHEHIFYSSVLLGDGPAATYPLWLLTLERAP
jgi:hypothetical protein